MANHKSADKRNRQRITRTVRGRALKSRVRTALKQARTAVDAGAANAAELIGAAVRLLDRAASKRVVPVGRASRLKSRLALHLRRGPVQIEPKG